MFTAALFMTAKTWKQPMCPSIEDWIKKIRYTYTMEYHSAIRKDEICTAICINMDGSWEYHAKQNKLERKSQEPHDLNHMGYKTESNKWRNKKNKQKTSSIQTAVWWLPEGKLDWGGVKSKGGQLSGDRRFDIGCWTHNVMYRWCTIQLYIWKLYNFINQCYPCLL